MSKSYAFVTDESGAGSLHRDGRIAKRTSRGRGVRDGCGGYDGSLEAVPSSPEGARRKPVLAVGILPVITCGIALTCLPATVPAVQPLEPTLCPVGSPFNINLPYSPYTMGQPGIPLLRRTIDTTLFPGSVCNDGSPAVMYIRPANAAYGGNPVMDPSTKWLIFLDGGGGCRNPDDCLLTRWCSGGGAIFDRAGKMSSLGASPAINSPGGIFELSPPGPFVNHFADYNHVLIHYCSSDNWIGSANHVGINTSTGTAYDIQFQGEAIVEAVITTLVSGQTYADPGPRFAFYSTPLPNLQGATEVVIGGESAGGGGVRHHIDRLREDMLEPAIADPEVLVRGVVDAGATPGMWDAAIDWGDPYSPADYRDHLLTMVEPPVRGFWGANDSALDESCLDTVWALDHDAVGSHPQVCYDTTYTLMNHITTPIFLREDINDPLTSRPYVMWNLYATSEDYRTAQYDLLDVFSSYTSTAGGLEAPLAAPGIQGPNCARHVAIQNNSGFFRHLVTGPGVAALSFHDLLVNWLNATPGQDTQQIQEDNPALAGYSASLCP